MAKSTAQMVKELRDETGAGMMDCKGALGETSGEMEAAPDPAGLDRGPPAGIRVFRLCSPGTGTG